MPRPLLLAIRNVNLIFLLLLIFGLFVVGKQTCAYSALEVLFGIDITIQSTSIVWHSDLFLYFISIFGTEGNNVPAWNDIKFSKKFRLGITALFFLIFGTASIYGGWTDLHIYSCF